MTLNYIGSKKKLIDFINIPISKIVSNTKKDIVFLDGFAGTGIVGSYFHNKYNFNIIANDLEYYSYIINHSLLCVKYSKN
jgi:adenine-specific DNA-methyltransferase